MVGSIILLTIVLSVVLAPQIAPGEPTGRDASVAMRPPSSEYLFGTDHIGRDVLTRVLYGGRLSLRVGFIAVIIAAVSGWILGTVAGFTGGYVDEIIMRIMDVFLTFPPLLLALVVVTVLGPGISNMMLAIGISGIPRFARLVRGSILSAKENVYVEAARALGARNTLIMWRHLTPNVLAPILVYGTLYVGTAILTAATMSFLGLGAEPPTPEWGLMLSEGRDFMRRAWWLTFFPGVAITLSVVAINMIGDGIRDILDPRL